MLGSGRSVLSPRRRLRVPGEWPLEEVKRESHRERRAILSKWQCHSVHTISYYIVTCLGGIFVS